MADEDQQPQEQEQQEQKPQEQKAGVLRTETLTEDGGLIKEVLREGTGTKTPPKGSKVNVHYVGTLLSDGSKFDSSRDRGDEFEFTIGNRSVIKGWDLGVATMKEGELCNLICSADYAYGAAGSPPKIPPNATLKFEVELISFDEEPEKKEWEMTPTEKIAEGTKKKELGNESFKAGDIAKAIKHYDNALRLVENLYDATDDEKAAASALKVTANNNLAACRLKTKEYGAAIAACNKALEVDEKNAKAYFRLGQAHTFRGDYADAREALLMAEKFSPDDPAVKKELAALAKKESEYRQKERAQAKKMFA